MENNQKSKYSNCLDSVEQTKPEKTSKLYKCRFGKKKEKTWKVWCTSYVRFTLEKDGSYSFHDADWQHNHQVNPFYCNTHCNSLKMQEIKVEPGHIRSNQNINLSSNNSFEIRIEFDQTNEI